MISFPFLAKYLVEKGIIDSLSVISGNLEITPASGRNYNFLVRTSLGASILKQGIWLDENRRAFHVERRFYRDIVPKLPDELRLQIPRPTLIDDREEILALEFVPNTMTFFQALQSSSANGIDAGNRLGEFLGRLHLRGVESDLREWLPQDAPWALRLQAPAAQEFKTISPGSYQCLKSLQARGALCAALQEAKDAWRTDCLVHADIRSDNILVSSRHASGGINVCVADWELVQIGDPAWDIAGFIHDLFLSWIFSLPASAPLNFDMLDENSLLPLTHLQRIAAEFLHAYSTACGGQIGPGLFERAFRLSGARLAQAAVECAQHNSSWHSEAALEAAERAMCIPNWATGMLLGSSATSARGLVQ